MKPEVEGQDHNEALLELEGVVGKLKEAGVPAHLILQAVLGVLDISLDPIEGLDKLQTEIAALDNFVKSLVSTSS